jgi:ribosomal-protein-alanine N-acetyltransferase
MLEGREINLRLFREEDLEEFTKLGNVYAERGDVPLARFFPLSKSKKEFAEDGWWSDERGHMLITDKQDRMLGSIGFFKTAKYRSGYEVGYGILRGADRNKGYMTAALRIFCAYLFEAKPIPRLELHADVANLASQRVAEKCGFKLEGTLRRVTFLRGVPSDARAYSLLREECCSLDEALRS